MSISPLKTSALLLAIVGLCGPALAGTAPAPTHHATALPAALRPALYQALAKNAGAAYRIGENGCATLPKSPLKACFNRHGAHFAGAGSLALRLAAYGRDGKLTAVKPVKPIIKGNRVSYPHGTLTAWWRVLPMGFEQGFTLTKRPAGHGKLTLALATSRQGAGTPHSDALVWGKLRYGKLIVTDARGKIVPATLKTNGDRILIVVNDTHAIYPLTIDPLVWIEQEVHPMRVYNGGAFGQAVAINGTTALVGAPGVGTVYVFTKSINGWAQTGKLTGGINYGAWISINSATALIGAPQCYVHWAFMRCSDNHGAAYVLTESNGKWRQIAMLTPSDAGANDNFGSSVALSKSAAFVGASHATVNGNARQGAVYVFTKSNGTWSETQKLTANNGRLLDQFGFSVAISGTTALVGAIAADPTSFQGGREGAVYVFKELNGNWSQAQELSPNIDGTDYEFGWSIELSGKTALIGAPQEYLHDGRVYVFKESNGAWSQTQKISPSETASETGGAFGYSIAISGRRAVVGAPDSPNGFEPVSDGGELLVYPVKQSVTY